jgi:hypothetical protein
MVYILGLTVLGTVVKELRGLRHFKYPGGDAVAGARESGPELRKRADSVCRGMGDMGDAPGALWGSDTHRYASSRCCSAHKRVLYGTQRIEAMIAAHNDTGHRGYYASHALLAERYWWPFVGRDLAWYVRTCHICQL